MKNINEIKSKVKKVETKNSLINGMYKNTSYGYTENGALTFTRSVSFLLDFFAQAGSMRGKEKESLELFKKAYSENVLYAIRTLFYLRDIRGGQGERKLFRNCLQWIGENDSKVFEQIIKYVSEYGRWDDMFFDNKEVFRVVKKQLKDDFKSSTPSLLAKWMPTINASSANTKAKAKFFAKNLGWSDIEYRKVIRKIRKDIKTVEEKMSANKWSDINYSTVPSRASMIYKNAFKKHDEKRYSDFIEKAKKGEVKINSGTLYPYEIYKKIKSDYSQTLEALWKQLPDYTKGKNALVVADVSGSMSGDPMAVSVSLALYFAERNVGQFKDYFITFSGQPTLQKVVGRNLQEKMYNIERSKWDMNTNLAAVFTLILKTAIQNSVEENEMPETIYIISDMEFDSCIRFNGTLFEDIKNKYKMVGYKIPNVVFWNVNASGKNLPVQKDEIGVTMVSGFSPSVFQIAVEGKTPEQCMFDVINSERYLQIVVNNY